jgi:hypothetical protein
MRRIGRYRSNIVTLALVTALLFLTTTVHEAQECDHQFITNGTWKIWSDVGTGEISVIEKQLDSVAENGDRIIGVSNHGVYLGLLWRITGDQWVYQVNLDGTTGDAQYALCVPAGTTIREWKNGKRVYEGMIPVKYYDTVMWAHIFTDYAYDDYDSSYTATDEYQVVDSIGLLRSIDLYLPSISYEILAVQINGKFIGNPIVSVQHEANVDDEDTPVPSVWYDASADRVRFPAERTATLIDVNGHVVGMAPMNTGWIATRGLASGAYILVMPDEPQRTTRVMITR